MILRRLNVNSRNLLDILENAIDCDPSSAYHYGYTAKEIHRKCIAHIKLLDQTIQALMVEKDIHVYGSGWGKDKDE
jgi:hypothetical protein